MSRTYRTVPLNITEETLRKDFEDGFYKLFHPGATFNDADEYVKFAMAHYRGERGTGVTSMIDVAEIDHRGKPLGYDAVPRCKEIQRHTSKLRRVSDKAAIDAAFDEMVDEAEEAIQESNELFEQESKLDYYGEDCNFDGDPLDYDWDDPNMYDDFYDPADDYYDDSWDLYDPPHWHDGTEI